jgi:hypothetical protein
VALSSSKYLTFFFIAIGHIQSSTLTFLPTCPYGLVSSFSCAKAENTFFIDKTRYGSFFFKQLMIGKKKKE